MKRAMQDSNFGDEQLDRLVDGELTASERAELLAWIESAPDGWRRCALAFLEAQAWSSDLRSVREAHRTAIVPQAAIVPPPVSRPRGVREARQWVGWAACLCVTFTAGWLAPRGSLLPPSSDTPFVSEASLQAPPITDRQDFAAHLPSAAGHDPVGRVKLMVDSSTPAAPIVDMPLYPPSDAQLHRLLHTQEVLPQDVYRRLQAMGYRVEQQRQLEQIPLEDGRQIILPVDEINIVPISQTTYY